MPNPLKKIYNLILESLLTLYIADAGNPESEDVAI